MQKLVVLFAGSLLSTVSLADASKGEAYFSSLNGGQCHSCHRTDGKKSVGPGLEGVSQRHSGEWLASFLSDPQQMWTSDHPETEELKKRIRKSRSPRTLCKKNPMSGEELQDLLDYLSTL